MREREKEVGERKSQEILEWLGKEMLSMEP